MQTFLPYADFDQTAKVLDMKRLGKQRVEATTLLETLINKSLGKNEVAWSNHPCTIMWEGCEVMLWLYINAICSRWTSLGYKDNQLSKATELLIGGLQRHIIAEESKSSQPWWLGSQLHLLHRSILIRKDPEFYAPQFVGVPDDLPVIWPAKKAPVPLTVPLAKEMFSSGSLRQ
jgi:hypothetical protein